MSHRKLRLQLQEYPQQTVVRRLTVADIESEEFYAAPQNFTDANGKPFLSWEELVAKYGYPSPLANYNHHRGFLRRTPVSAKSNMAH